MTDNILLRTTANPAIKQGYIDTPQGQIHYWTAGKGEPFLLIHQSSSSVEEYAGMVPFLADTYKLISFDWPGHGNSDDPDQELGVEAYTASAKTVLDHLNIDRCHILGHHGGALLAMNLAYLYPNQIDKVVLSGTSGLKKAEEAQSFKKSLPSHTAETLQRDGQFIIDAWNRYTQYLPDATASEILIPFLNNLRNRIRPYDAHHGVLGWDRRAALNSLKEKPVLLIQGALDPFVSKQEELLDILPQAERAVIPQGGAFMFFDKSKECAKIIRDFLEKS